LRSGRGGAGFSEVSDRSEGKMMWKGNNLKRGDVIIKPAYVEEAAITQSDRRFFRVIFQDRYGREYVWVPRWRDVRWVYERALVFERKQYGKTREFRKFLTYVMNYAKLLQMFVKGVRDEEDLRTALKLYLEFYDEKSYGKGHDGFGYKELEELVELLNLHRFHDPIVLTEKVREILHDFETEGIVKRIGSVYVFSESKMRKLEESVMPRITSEDELRAVILDELKYYKTKPFTLNHLSALIIRYGLEETFGGNALPVCYQVLKQLEKEGVIRRVELVGRVEAWQFVGREGD